VISLKRYIESNRDELLNCTLGCYRSTLAATATFGVQACPPVGENFQQNLLNLQQRISGDVTPGLLASTQKLAEQELREWGESASNYLKHKATEVKDLMMVLAQAADTIGMRDQRYGEEFGSFSAQLRAIADLEDLTKIRTSLIESATQLKTCLAKMAEESRQSVAQLRAEVSLYQCRLEESERLAVRDSLTGLDNRRKIEQELEDRILRSQTFTVMLLDLNEFKAINDELGHETGDEVLKQFALELKSALRTADIVGRWGGDEFIVLLDCALTQSEAQVARVRQWVCGEYTVSIADGPRKIRIHAAIGLASWNQGETMKDLVKRADVAMYQDKRSAVPASSPSGGKRMF
jgi:diguanylate cyclase (GGDEF)-like protein